MVVISKYGLNNSSMYIKDHMCRKYNKPLYRSLDCINKMLQIVVKMKLLKSISKCILLLCILLLLMGVVVEVVEM